MPCMQDCKPGNAALVARCVTLMGTASLDQQSQAAARFLCHCLDRNVRTSVAPGSFFTSCHKPPSLAGPATSRRLGTMSHAAAACRLPAAHLLSTAWTRLHTPVCLGQVLHQLLLGSQPAGAAPS